MRLVSSTSWEGIFTTITNLFHIFMFYILKSTYLYPSWGYFLKNNYFWPIWYDVPGWHSAEWQSVIPAFWMQSATPALRIRFGTLCQWCVKFLPRIFYPFWAPHIRKLRIGPFDRRATKWCFWLACDQNLCSVFLTAVRPGKALKIRD